MRKIKDFNSFISEDREYESRNNSSPTMTMEKIEKILKNLRHVMDLNSFMETNGEEFCRTHRVKENELDFLVGIVSTERTRKENERLKREILSRRNHRPTQNQYPVAG